jgi:hypothetical protein
MAQEVLVDELKKLARELEKAVGPVALLMLLPADSASEEAWNVLVSARAFDHRSRKEALNELAAHLRGALSDPVKSSITRATVLKSDDPFVRAMNSAVHIERSKMDLYSRVVSGVEIPHAIVFESKPIAA